MKILLATCNAANRAFLLKALNHTDFDPQWVTGDQLIMEKMLSPDAPRIVVLDSTWPGEDSLALCRHLRAGATAHYLYLLLLARSNAPEKIAHAFTAGFDACLTPPYNSCELAARLRVAQRVLRLQS